MNRVRTVAVIGGGIAGPVAALALRKAGIEATVYESHPTTADGVGGTIAIAPNGMAALDIVGAAAPAAAASWPVHRQVMTVGRKRLELPGLPDAGPLHVINRSDLYRILAANAPIEYGKRLVTAVSRQDGIAAAFADGEEIQADILIGADGVHSTVRSLIDPAAPGPHFTGMLALEGHSPMSVPEEAGTMVFAFGKRGFYLYGPALGGGTTIGINLPHRPLTIAEARAIPRPQWKDTLLEIYGEDSPGGDLIRQLPAEDLTVNGALHIMPPVPRWHRGRMVLTGDAVHAPSNSSGQGASLAIESAIELAQCLRDIPDVTEAFSTYERLRRIRVEKVAARAARTNSVKAPGPIGKALMPIIMRAFMKFAMNPEKVIGPEQRYRIDWAKTL
ncbi:2-polyprenyl-6-methoxyphenol hydroxylase-like FAD-dependent oxidoreductase [Actinoplanes tereljensis]|uniref:FAD-dependent oxidoreductase n=1 Tax=Paractinoplanes tereljensis TaxID=571912 RepID=A0A919TQZ9_9ACTN|nr:FAD-dependent monooxygenase [Actinoplanes tereljensis]GIF17617.1 FAD-dependent oxidoreductase [Actinoplanes tereljensis]